MEIQTMAVFANNGGYRAKLLIELTETTDDWSCALLRDIWDCLGNARTAVRNVLGLPEGQALYFSCNLEPYDNPFPPVTGWSMYGAVSAALLQACVKEPHLSLH